jgi:hypothetical protein
MPVSGRRGRFLRCAERRGAFGNQASGLQAQLGPSVAERKAVVLAQLVVEVLGGEPAVARAVELEHLVHTVDRHPPGRGLAEPPVEQTRHAFALVPLAPAPEAPLAHAQDLGGLRLA